MLKNTPSTPKGFILLTTLVFLQIFSIMGLYGLINASMAIKVDQHGWAHMNHRLMADQLLREREKAIEASLDVPCKIPMTPPATLTKQSLSWWQREACHDNVNGIHYYYTLEALGPDACGIIKKIDEDHYITADYYRITLLVIFEKQQQIWQSTIAREYTTPLSCEALPHIVRIGRQMQRELIGRQVV